MNAAAQLNTSSNPLIDRENKTRNLSFDYRIDGLSPLLNIQALAYWNEVDMSEQRVSDGRADQTNLDVYGFNFNNRSDWEAVTLLYGVDGYREEFKADRAGTSRPARPRATSDTWGAFIQASVSLTEQWRIELGARYDRFATEARQLDQDRSDSYWSPSAALVWRPTGNTEVVLRHDRAFRAPGAEELYTTGAHFCLTPTMCNTFLPNPDLDPEKAANTELLGRVHFEQVLGGDLILQGAVFRNNVDEAVLKDFEIGADYRVESLRWQVSYGQTRGEDRDTGEDLINIPADALVNGRRVLQTRRARSGVPRPSQARSNRPCPLSE